MANWFSDPLNILSIFGVWALLHFVFNKVLPCLYWWYAYTCRCGKDLKAYGEWAVITGATDGIGKCYAMEFAQRGINVVLISRNKKKCEVVEEELKALYPKVQFTHLAIDFGNFDAAARERVKSKVEGLDVGILINNVGYGGSYPKYFFEQDEEEMTSQTEININSTLWMTKILLGDDKQGMIARKRGAIVSIGSQACYAPTALTSCYGAAKAYILMLSRSLHAEMAEYNIHVSVQTPGRVFTNMFNMGTSGLFFPTAERWVKSAVNCIGYDAAVAGYGPHEFRKWAENQVSEESWNKGWMTTHLAIRDQVLKDFFEGKFDKAPEPAPAAAPPTRSFVSVQGADANPGMD